jgi:phage tail-like protein
MSTTNDAVSGDPLVSFKFGLEVGKVSGYFTEVSGLGSEHEVVEHKIMAPDGHKEIVRKIPGRLKWGDITLKRGITANMDAWKWRKEVEDGTVSAARVNGSIMMFSQEGDIIARWDFENGWPSKITGPTPKSDSNEVGIEEMVIVHEKITRVK